MATQFVGSNPGATASAVLAQVRKTIFGMDDEIRLALVAFYCGRHVLLEGNPGLGKTTLVKAFSSALHLPYRRIQFTPDLMPSDITGTRMPGLAEGTGGQWRFEPGPVFTNLLLADEINRATPKTQSAMLEAMEEKQVTVLNETYYLPDNMGKKVEDAPFMVFATQNPIDHEGVYNLPEAQADRFMFKLIVRMPALEHLISIMYKVAGQPGELHGHTVPDAVENEGILAGSRLTADQEGLRKSSLDVYRTIRRQIRAVPDLPMLSHHIANMVMASNGRIEQLYMPARSRENQGYLIALVKLFQFGLGPRAAINLLFGAKALRLLFPPQDLEEGHRSRLLPDEPGVGQLAQLLVPTLRHRLHLAYDWEEEARFRALPDADARIQAFIYEFAYRTAPDDDLYRRRLRDALGQVAPEVAGRL